MSDIAARIRARIVQSVHAAEVTTMRADHLAITRAAQHLAAHGLLDEPSAEFLRDAPQLVIALTAALNAVLDIHQGTSSLDGASGGCGQCDTNGALPCRTVLRLANVFTLHRMRQLPCVDAADAWRRAQARCHPVQSGEVASLVYDLQDAFAVRNLVIAAPPPPSRVATDTERVLLVDKETGRSMIWPLMAWGTLDAAYTRYKRDSTIPPTTNDTPQPALKAVPTSKRPRARITVWFRRLTRRAR
ncbi:hypothetical protein [Actinomadura rupiterrae]|uniref:hypothetical protein n=1 Tax=Actinomadura rupiterrae TaxID=559627 RepID=UPI0020A61A0D|nr:hypothetical protein [Actinomadura rupiterrae]MCP2335175.1 hypothetical protein [Actinomadura rupiterrae]